MEITNIQRRIARQMPFSFILTFPLTSLGEANIAPKEIVIPIPRASHCKETTIGINRANIIKIALEKSVLRKKSVISDIFVYSMFFFVFKRDESYLVPISSFNSFCTVSILRLSGSLILSAYLLIFLK